MAKEAAGAELKATAMRAPRADQRGQTGDGAHRHAAAVVTLDAVVDADRRGAGGGIVARQVNDALRRHAGDGRGARWRPLAHAAGKLVKPHCVARYIIIIMELLGNDDVHHRQGQRAVRARTNGKPFVGGLGSARARRVDDKDARALFARGLHKRPQMQIARQRVATPDQDQARVGKIFRRHAFGRAEGVEIALEASFGADRARQPARAHALEKARRHAFAL